MREFIIVGGGPIGLYMAGVLESHGRDYLLLEANRIGGQIHLYPEKLVTDVPAFGSLKSKEILGKLLKDIDYARIIEGCTVNSIRKNTVETSLGTYGAKTIIITTGRGHYEPRKLGLEGEERASNILYALLRPEELRGKKVLIFGGGDSALDWAKELSDISEVHLIHRRREFRGNPKTIEGARVNLHLPYIPYELEVKGSLVKAVIIENVETKEHLSLPCDVVLVNFGAVPKIETFGLPSREDHLGFSVDDHFKVEEGIYACGDCVQVEGYAKRMAPGFKEADAILQGVLSA